MATVYPAEDYKHKRKVAVKSIADPGGRPDTMTEITCRLVPVLTDRRPGEDLEHERTVPLRVLWSELTGVFGAERTTGTGLP